ncbi:MAG: hypothetical protein IAE66_00840 [Xanthomonadaceae bacterium]|nr:hypothetical protein [Xanthomonadaceae bacterium]
MKLENVVGLVGGISALAGCFLPLVSNENGTFMVAQAGGLSFLLYVLAALGILASLAGLAGKARKEEYVQVVAGILGLIVSFIVYHQADTVLGTGGRAGWGVQLLFWGFALVLVEGLFNFRDHRKPAFGTTD